MGEASAGRWGFFCFLPYMLSAYVAAQAGCGKWTLATGRAVLGLVAFRYGSPFARRLGRFRLWFFGNFETEQDAMCFLRQSVDQSKVWFFTHVRAQDAKAFGILLVQRSLRLLVVLFEFGNLCRVNRHAPLICNANVFSLKPIGQADDIHTTRWCTLFMGTMSIWTQHERTRGGWKHGRRNDNPRAVALTQRDLMIFLELYRNRLMHTGQLQALYGDKMDERLKRLFDAGYIDWPPVQKMWRHPGSGSRPNVWALGNLGAWALVAESLITEARATDWNVNNRRLKRSSLFMPHTLAVNDVKVAFASPVCAVA